MTTLTELEQTFIEVVAREIRHAGTPRRCGGCGFDGNVEIATHAGWFAEVHQTKVDHPFTPRTPDEDPARREDELHAAILLGAVEAINAPLEEIVKAAEAASDAASACSNCGHGAFHRFVVPHGCEECGCVRPAFTNVFTIPAFTRAIAREYLGIGKVFEEFPAFNLRPSGGREEILDATVPFSVPRRRKPPEEAHECPRCGDRVSHYTAHHIKGQYRVEGYTCDEAGKWT